MISFCSLSSFLLVFFFFFSCAEKEEFPEVKAGRSIRFYVEYPDVPTKGGESTIASLENIGLYAYHTNTERWLWAVENIPGELYPNYFCNTKLKKNTSTFPNYWEYEGITRYWPPDTRNKVSFFMYAPYNAPGLSLYPEQETNAGSPSITYEVPEDVSSQVDLVYDAQLDQSRDITDDIEVKFRLKHALTRVSFDAKLDFDETIANGHDYTAKITRIEWRKMYVKAKLDWVTGDWQPVGNPESWVLNVSNGLDAGREFQTANSISSSYVYQPLLSVAAGTMMLIPQATDGIQLIVTIQFVQQAGSAVTKTKTYELKDISSFLEASKHLVYQINIKEEEWE
jgi:hypothetical protein